MEVNWRLHADDRFWQRIMRFGIERDELDYEIKLQKLRFIQDSNQTIKTIFCIQNIVITVIKSENKKTIDILTMWESNKKEEEIWKKHATASAAEKRQ